MFKYFFVLKLTISFLITLIFIIILFYTAFRIQNADLIYYRDQIVELFPTEIKDYFYIPHKSTKKSQKEKDESDQEEEESEEREECLGAKGCLYNYYKLVRKELRIAGIFNPSKRRKIDISYASSKQGNIDIYLFILS